MMTMMMIVDFCKEVVKEEEANPKKEV